LGEQNGPPLNEIKVILLGTSMLPQHQVFGAAAENHISRLNNI
jgi:hypothetical protein